MPAFWAHKGGNPTPQDSRQLCPHSSGQEPCGPLKLRSQPHSETEEIPLMISELPSLSERIVRVHNWRTLWFCSMGYKKSDGHPFFHLIFFLSSLVPSGSVSVGISPSLFLASAEMADQVYESHLISLSNDCPATPLVFSSEQGIYLFFLNYGQAENFPSSSSFLCNNSFLNPSLSFHILL